MSLAKKLGAVIASMGMVSVLAVPTFADTTLVIKDNGADSKNSISNSENCVSTVSQSSHTGVGVHASLGSNSGDNEANSNTGGTTTIQTGKATSNFSLTVRGGKNIADAPDCCKCDGGETVVRVKNNGKDSRNTVRNTRTKRTRVRQRKNTSVHAGAWLKANTGKNEAKNNTGAGVEVTTDNSRSELEIVVNGGSNTLNP